MAYSKNDDIFAAWVNDTVWVENGNQIYYDHHMGGWFHDKEIDIDIRNGKVNRITHHDYSDQVYISESWKDDFDFRKYICENADWEKLNLEGGEVKVYLVQDNDTVFVTKTSENSNENFEKEALRIVKTIRTTSLYKFGVRARFRFYITITFSKDIKSLCD